MRALPWKLRSVKNSSGIFLSPVPLDGAPRANFSIRSDAS